MTRRVVVTVSTVILFAGGVALAQTTAASRPLASDTTITIGLAWMIGTALVMCCGAYAGIRLSAAATNSEMKLALSNVTGQLELLRQEVATLTQSATHTQAVIDACPECDKARLAIAGAPPKRKDD